MAGILFNPATGKVVTRNGKPIWVADGEDPCDCCGEETCCDWTICPDGEADPPDKPAATFFGGVAGSGMTPYIFSSICDPGPPIIFIWDFTGVADSFQVRCEDGNFTLTYSCPSAPFEVSYDLNVVSCVPFIAHAVVNIVHSSGFGACEINLVGDFYILEDPDDLP